MNGTERKGTDVRIVTALLAAAVALGSWAAQATERDEAIRAFFEREVYGALPPKPEKLAFELKERGEAFGGLAERRQYRIVSTDEKGTHAFGALVYLPRGAERPAPTFVYPNFSGNHSIVDDEKVFVEEGPVFGGKREARGARTDRVPVRRLLERGFAFATACYCSVYPDYAGTKRDAVPESIYAIFPERKLTRPLMAHPAWSWGAMRVRDLLATLPEIDQRHVAIAGQSRMGKNAIVTGVNDSRFALVCANCGGTKALKHLPNLLYPEWFAPGLRKYALNDKTGVSRQELEERAKAMPDPPFDQGDYLGLIAPRGLCVGAASEDRWAPPDESMACVRKAQPAFERFGRTIGWHCKKGPHSITHEDWESYMDFALNQLGWHTARAPDGLNIRDAFVACADVLDRYCGHAAAGGFSVKEGRIDDFRRLLCEYCEKNYVCAGDTEEGAVVDYWIEPQEITMELAEDLRKMEPFGEGNREPIFGLRSVRFSDVKPMGADGRHLSITVNPTIPRGAVASRMRAVWWNHGD